MGSKETGKIRRWMKEHSLPPIYYSHICAECGRFFKEPPNSRSTPKDYCAKWDEEVSPRRKACRYFNVRTKHKPIEVPWMRPRRAVSKPLTRSNSSPATMVETKRAEELKQKILSTLRHLGKAKTRELSSETGISEPAVSRLLHRLLDTGEIKKIGSYTSYNPQKRLSTRGSVYVTKETHELHAQHTQKSRTQRIKVRTQRFQKSPNRKHGSKSNEQEMSKPSWIKDELAKMKGKKLGSMSGGGGRSPHRVVYGFNPKSDERPSARRRKRKHAREKKIRKQKSK